MPERSSPPVAREALANTSLRLVVAGVAAGLLAGLLGVGGGIIIVPGLIWALGLDRHTATGTSLLAIVPIAVVGTTTYALAPGGAFDAPASLLLVAGSLVGAVYGANVNARVSERGLRIAFAVLTLALGLRLVTPIGLPSGSPALPLDLAAVLVLLAVGLLGGVLSGLLGVGGSLVMIAILVLVLHVSQVLAQGIGLAATIPTVLAGAWQHRRQGTLDVGAALRLGLPGMLGAIPGALLAFHIPAGSLRIVFGAFLLVMGARALAQLRRRAPG